MRTQQQLQMLEERREAILRDKESAVTYRPEFVGFRCDHVDGEGFKARVRVAGFPDFTAAAYNYQEAKMNAFRQAAEALGV